MPKRVALLLVLALGALSPLRGGPESRSFLIKAARMIVQGNQVVVASGNASVLCGDMRITADEIVLDRPQKLLRLTGAVTLQVAGKTLEAKELTLDVGSDRVFLLSNDNVVLLEAPGFVESRESSLEFSAQHQRTPTALRPSAK